MMKHHGTIALLVCLALCAVRSMEASAQPTSGALAESELGCAQCSPPQDRQRAQELFLAARSLLEQEQHEQAAELYEQALEHWDNPLIRYGLARALYLQGRLVEAHAHVVEVLAYGTECFDPRMWNNVQKLASHLRKLLSNMGEIEILCREPGARIGLQGAPEFVCRAPEPLDETNCPKPVRRVEIDNGWTFTRLGKAKRLVRSGAYQLIARKRLHDTAAKPIMVVAGRRSRVEIDLAVAAQPRASRRGSAVPAWFLIGAGTTSLGIGVTLHADANRATTTARSFYIAGGVTLAGGLTWMIIHYARPAPRKKQGTNAITVLPLLSGETVGAAIELDF
jgi:hypothetical protein